MDINADLRECPLFVQHDIWDPFLRRISKSNIEMTIFNFY